MPPTLQEWDGDLWGDTGQGKGSSQIPGSGWSSGKIPAWALSAVSCTPIPWASCPSRGDPTPTSCLTAGKGFETTAMARGKTLLGWGHPKEGVQGHSRPPGQGSMDTARLRTSTLRKGGGFGADPGDLSPNPSTGRAVGEHEQGWGSPRAGGGQEVTLGGKGTPGRMELVLGIPELGKAGAGVAGVAVSWQRVFIPK